MILQSLHEYYQRKQDLPPPGFDLKEIPFVIEVNKTGVPIQIEDTRTQDGKVKRGKSYLVPQPPKKSANILSSLLWGNAEYVLGVPDQDKLVDKKTKGKEADYKQQLQKRRESFVEAIKALSKEALADEGVCAVLQFIQGPNLNDLQRFEGIWEEIRRTNPNISFRLQGDIELVCQRKAVKDAVAESAKRRSYDGICLVTGQPDEIERLHPAIKGVRGAKTSGANIVAVNDNENPAFASHGKHQGYNSPVGKSVSFEYTAALNRLLSRNSHQRVQVGDASTVFWADKPSPLEDNFSDIFEEPPKDDPDRNARALKALYEAPQQGVAPINDTSTRFFVLGLGPNGPRIAIRFWHVGTVAELARTIQQHFDDLEIAQPAFEKPYLSVFRLLLATATQGKSENIPPNLGGEVMRAVLTGVPYPATLLQGAVRRIRAEQAKRDKRTGKSIQNVTYARAALIKACLNRLQRKTKKTEREATVSLDYANANSGYRLGRLFAALEKIQEEANPRINATIRERFYGAASSTPVTVFSNLMKLKNHHLAKLENPGRKINLERLIGEILNGISEFPSHLSLADQGRFAIGYYHQRQALFSKSTETK